MGTTLPLWCGCRRYRSPICCWACLLEMDASKGFHICAVVDPSEPIVSGGEFLPKGRISSWFAELSWIAVRALFLQPQPHPSISIYLEAAPSLNVDSFRQICILLLHPSSCVPNGGQSHHIHSGIPQKTGTWQRPDNALGSYRSHDILLLALLPFCELQKILQPLVSMRSRSSSLFSFCRGGSPSLRGRPFGRGAIPDTVRFTSLLYRWTPFLIWTLSRPK